MNKLSLVGMQLPEKYCTNCIYLCLFPWQPLTLACWTDYYGSHDATVVGLHDATVVSQHDATVVSQHGSAVVG